MRLSAWHVVIGIFFVLVAMATSPFWRMQRTQQNIVIHVTAERFKFTPDDITLHEGDHVAFEIEALDFPHGFSLPDFHIRQTLVPGETVRVELTPDKSGTFTFLCDNFCGSGHEDMNGLIHVEE